MNWLKLLPALLAAGSLVLIFSWGTSLYLDNARLRAEAASLQRSITTLQMQVEASEKAREIEIVRAEKEKQRAAELSAIVENLLTGEIPDADLDPDLIDLLERLREGN